MHALRMTSLQHTSCSMQRRACYLSSCGMVAPEAAEQKVFAQRHHPAVAHPDLEHPQTHTLEVTVHGVAAAAAG